MESEGKRSPSSGHGHRCTKCGWAFPNPHPSAKHRRAHKKHCGNIDGFPLIAAAAAANGLFSDEDPGEALKAASNHEINNPASYKTLEPYNQAHAKKVQSFNVQIVADQLENGSQLKCSLPYNITISSGIENDRISASSCPNELMLEDSSEKTGDLAFDALKRDFKLHGDIKATDISLEASEEMKAFDSKDSLILEEQLVAGQNSQNELFSCNGVKVIPDGASGKLELLDTKASLSQGKQTTAAGRDSQNELFCTGPCPVEINTGDNLSASSSAAPIENFCDMVGDCIVKGNIEENSMTGLFMLPDISLGEIPEMENALRKHDELRVCNLSVIYPDVEGGNNLGQIGEKLDAIENKVLDSTASFTLRVQQGEESRNELFSCIGVDDFPVETSLKTKLRESKASLLQGKHLDVAGQDSQNEPDGSEGSPVAEYVESENVGAVRKSSVLDCLKSDEMVHHPQSKTRESSGAQETDIIKPASVPCEIIVAPAELEAERERSFEGQDTHHNSCDEILSENHVDARDGNCALSCAFKVDEANNLIDENQHINYGKIGNTGSDVIVCCRQEPSKPGSFQSDTKVESETKNITSESEIVSVEIKGQGGLESSNQIAAPTLHCSVLNPECTDIGHSKKYGPLSDELNIQNDPEEGTIELAADNDSDHPVTQADSQTKHIEKENTLTRPIENLDQEKVPTQSLKSMSVLHSDKLDNQKNLLETLKEPAVHNKSSHPFTQDMVPIARTGKESNPDEQPHEDVSLNDSGEDGVCNHGSYNLRLQGHTTSLVYPQASALIPVTLDCALSRAFNIDEATNLINENQHSNYGKLGNTGSDVIVCCRQEPSKPGSLQSGTKVESKPKKITSESELVSVEIKGKGELESSTQIAAPTLHSSALSPECTDIGHSKKYGPCSDELNIQNNPEEGTIELAAGNDSDHPVTQANSQTGHIEKENTLTRPLENLDQQKVPTQSLKSMSALYSDKLDNLKNLLETLKEPAVHNNTSHPFTQDMVPIACTGKEGNPDEQPHEDVSLNDSGEDGVCNHGSYNVRLQGHTTSLVDPQASALIPVTLDNVNSCDNSEVVPSPTCNQSLQEGGDHFASRQLSDVVLVVMNASADANNPTDFAEEQGGSVSDGLLVPNTETIPGSSEQRMEDLHTSDMVSGATSAENSTGNVDRLESPSYVTLEKSVMHPASSEIQPMQIPQHTSPSQTELQTVHESRGENKNLETNEKVVKWVSDKAHIRLKDLLADAGLESKQKATTVHSHKTLLPSKKDQSSEMVSEHSNDPSNKVEHKEWNSPARLPDTEVTKKKVKGKSTWLAFICCSYIPKEIQ